MRCLRLVRLQLEVVGFEIKEKRAVHKDFVMIIQYASDLHLERSANFRHVMQGGIAPAGDVLVLAGDVANLFDLERCGCFWDWCSEHFKQTIFVPGNHDYYGTWRAMEEAYRAGKLRAIGVSNFYPDRFIDLAEFCDIKPMVNQVETHVFNQQRRPQEIMKEYGTQIMSWGPFAEGRNGFFSNPVLKAIGEKYGKSVAQTALRFLIQRGVVVIPKSTHKERMVQNLDVFDFSLSAEDMDAIGKLDKGESLFFSHYAPETVKFLTSLGK